MSLTRLFNKDFFIQNLKKSKAVIIFISLLLPVFTLLLLNMLNDFSGEVSSFWSFAGVNLFFMYGVPVVLSIELFSFIFKKNSCDFIGSMPLSRKTIFATNTIGGIIIIVLIQLITMVFCAAFSRLFAPNTVFMSMLWDIFIYFTISYIFVFTVTNLAVSFSGNMFATIVSTMVLLFFIPFIFAYSKGIATEEAGISSFDADTDSGVITYFMPFNFTAPSMIFEAGVYNTSIGYNNKSIAKMVALSAIYIIVGYYLFKRKRYEMAEESYETTTVHLIMKFLSITPFVAVMCLTELYKNGIALMFFLAILAVYFFVFDMITNKKLKVSVSIISYIVSLLTMYAFFDMVVPHLDIFFRKDIQIADIKSITIDYVRDQIGFYNNEFGLVVTDEALIRDALTDKSDYTHKSSYKDYYSEYYLTLTLKDKAGDEYTINKWVGKSFDKILDKYGDEEFKLKHGIGIPHIDSCKLTTEDIKALKESLSSDLSGLSFKEYYKKISNDRENYYLTYANYKNHRLIISDFSYEGFEKTSVEAIKILNREAGKNSIKSMHWNLSNQDVFGRYLLKKNMNVYFDNYDETLEELNKTTEMQAEPITIEDFEIDENFDEINEIIETDNGYDYDKTIYGVISNGMNSIDRDRIVSFIDAHKDDSFDKTKPYIVLIGYPTNIFYTNSIEDFYMILANAYNQSEYPENSGIILNEQL